MYNSKAVMTAASISLLINTGTALAGRYGDAEIRHWHAISERQQAKSSARIEQRAVVSTKARETLHRKSPFQKHSAG